MKYMLTNREMVCVLEILNNFNVKCHLQVNAINTLFLKGLCPIRVMSNFEFLDPG